MADGGKIKSFYEVVYIDRDKTKKVVAKFIDKHEAYVSANNLMINMPKVGKTGTYVVNENTTNKFKDGGYMAKGGEMREHKWYVVSAKEDKVVSKGFDSEEDAKKEMYDLYEKNKDFSLATKKMAKGGKTAVRNEGVDEISEMGGKRYGVEIQDEESGDVLDYEYFDSEEEAEDFVNKYKRGGYMADGGRIKGRNNETGETYGVVIGSVKKSDENIEDGTEMNVRKGYSSRISEVKLVFDNNGNLYEITDYGYALEGNYPETSGGTVKTYIANKKETLEILSKKYNPAFAKKLIELAKNPKMAEGGMTEHGLKIGDTIVDNIFWDDSIKVLNNKTGYAVVDLENGERKGEMAKGGSLTDNFSDKIEEGDIVWDERNKSYGVVLNTYDYKYGEIRLDSDGNQPIEYLHKLGSEKDKGTKAKLQDALLAYKSLRLKWPEYKYEKVNYEKGGYMADGGVTAKEVVESNADMVLSQIKAVKHHAEELSSVVSRKSNIEAWVVGKIERASTDLSDITHYLEGNKDKMSMGGTVRHYAHKMDKK